MPSASLISMSTLIAAMRKRLRIAILLSALFFALTCIYLWSATPLYEASITITSRPEESTPIPRLASSLGLSVLSTLGGRSTMTSYEKLIEVLPSRDTATELLADEEIMARLYPEEWDAATKSWRRPTSLAARARGVLNALFGLPGWSQPAAEPVMAMLEDKLRIAANDGGRFHTVSFRTPDPALAGQVLETALSSADRLLRQRDRSSVSENVTFLRARIREEQLVDVREAIANQLGEQFVRSAMLSSSGPYAYETMEALSVSSRPVTPRPLLSLILAVLAGTIIGVVASVLLPRTEDVELATSAHRDH